MQKNMASDLFPVIQIELSKEITPIQKESKVSNSIIVNKKAQKKRADVKRTSNWKRSRATIKQTTGSHSQLRLRKPRRYSTSTKHVPSSWDHHHISKLATLLLIHTLGILSLERSLDWIFPAWLSNIYEMEQFPYVALVSLKIWKRSQRGLSICICNDAPSHLSCEWLRVVRFTTILLLLHLIVRICFASVGYVFALAIELPFTFNFFPTV